MLDSLNKKEKENIIYILSKLEGTGKMLEVDDKQIVKLLEKYDLNNEDFFEDVKKLKDM